jgi:hypothetical protein
MPRVVMNAMPPDEKRRPGGGAASQDPLAADHPKHNGSLDIIDTLAAAAIAYAEHHWPVLPLRGKVPAIANPHPKGSRERRECKGECGLRGHGVLDASTDPVIVEGWWTGRYRFCNIGGRVPASMFVLDIISRFCGSPGSDGRPRPF